MHLIDILLPTLEHFRILGYWIILALAFWESTAFIGMAIPGVLLFPAVGFLVAHGYFDPIDAFWFCFLGAMGGYCLSYYLGSKGEGLAAHFKSLAPQVESGKKFLMKYGLWAMLPGRFMAVGAIMPFLVGFAHSPFRPFFAFAITCNAIGVGGYLLAGYLAGHAWISLGIWFTRLLFFLVAVAALLLLIFLCRTLVIKGAWPAFAVLSSIISSIGDQALKLKIIKSFMERHARSTRFITERFDPARFEGLPLTLLGLALVYSVVLLGGLVQDLLAADPIVEVDRRLAALLLVFRTSFLLAVFIKVTLLGNWQIILGGVFLFSLYLFVDRKFNFLIPFWVSMGGCGFFTTVGKWLFHRQRPFDMTNILEFSFPSGHSAYVACFYGFISYFLIRQTKSRKRRVDLVFIWILIFGTVGFSRLYLGVHYLSDVLAGGLLGLSWLLIGISLVEWKESSGRSIEAESLQHAAARIKMQHLGPVLLAVWIFLCILVAASYTPPYFKGTKPQLAALKLTNPLAPFDSGQLPKFTETMAGRNQEPLSIMIIVKDEKNLVNTMKKAGWNLADPVSIRSVAQAFKAALMNESYPHAPVTPSFWNALPLDFAFEKETSQHSIRQRHHIRLWKTGCRLPDGSWQYVGSASFDKGINWLHFSHSIDPAIDLERQTLLSDCIKANIVSAFSEVIFVAPTMGTNFSGDAFFSDGKIVILYFSSSAF